MEKQYKIGQVSKMCGLGIHAIRYYEQFGLIRPSIRSNGGYRLYSRQDIDQLIFIKRAHGLGFTLREIKTIIQSSRQGLASCCGHLRKELEKKLKEFESKIAELQKMKREVNRMLSDWIPLEEARKRAYVVCPQIESERKKRKK